MSRSPKNHRCDPVSIFREKDLLWIEESNQRFYAYNHFGQHPERLIGWFDRHMGQRASDQSSPQTKVA
jgi:hypothetical protein